MHGCLIVHKLLTSKAEILTSIVVYAANMVVVWNIANDKACCCDP